MVSRLGSSLVLAAALLACGGVGAQQAQDDDGPRAHEFWPVAPKVGDLFPDVTVVDDRGEPVNVRDIARENYSVLVLGCLT